MIFHTTVEDTSPFLQYYPYADGIEFQNGWVQTFGGKRWKNFGEGGSGISLHTTSLSGAKIMLEFFGSGIDIYGTSNMSDYTITLDRETQTIDKMSLPPNTLFSNANLTNAPHTITIAATSSDPLQQFSFDRAIISDSTLSTEPNFVQSLANDARFIYGGTWETRSRAGIPNSTVELPFQYTEDPHASVSTKFSSATGVEIYSSSNFGHQEFSITLNGQEYIRNASTFWIVPDTLRFYKAGLDPTQEYEIVLANRGTARLTFTSMTLHSSEAAAPNSTSRSTSTAKTKKVHPAVIVAPIVSVVVITSIFLIWWLLRRRKRYNNSSTDLIITPFPESQNRRLPPISINPFSHKRRGAANVVSPSTQTVATSPADVDRLVELIAQRIDRQPHTGDSLSPPPFYEGQNSTHTVA